MKWEYNNNYRKYIIGYYIIIILYYIYYYYWYACNVSMHVMTNLPCRDCSIIMCMKHTTLSRIDFSGTELFQRY